MTTTILQFGATGQLAREMLLRSSGGVTIKEDGPTKRAQVA